MFGRKKKSWYGRAFKALIFVGFIYRCARFFMKMADKQAGVKKEKKAKEKSVRA
jgi:hypothetical protein